MSNDKQYLAFYYKSDIWRIHSHPESLGEDRDLIIDSHNKEFGLEKWRFAWKYKNKLVNLQTVLMLYEESYYQHALKNPSLWDYLIYIARDVYDIEERDILSGKNYKIQINDATHYQDIAIRRVLSNLNMNFEGRELIQVRNTSQTIGKEFSPGLIPFICPKAIDYTIPKDWWNKNSVEAFYNQNRRLIIQK